MKGFLLLLCCVPLLLCGQDLKIATFNCEFLVEKKVHVKYGLPFNLKYASKTEQKQWNDATYRKQQFVASTNLVAAHLKSLNADVLGLTEVGNIKEVEQLVGALKKAGLNYPYWKVCKSMDRGTGQHVAVLSKYELTEVVPAFEERGLYFTESDGDETAETGISKAMKATVVVKGEKIHCFVFHLKSERGGEDSDQKRIMQAEIARRVLIPYLQSGEHVVVMGDLNSEKRHEVLLTIRGFRDVYSELVQTGDNYYFDDFTTRWTYAYKGQQEQIDHILLSIGLKNACKSNNPKQKQMGVHTSIVPTNDKKVSDHNALVVELTFD